MLPGSHVRISLHFQLQQERIKICNSKPNSFFKKLFKGYWRRPAFLKNQSGKLPEPSNSPRNWKKWKTYQNRTLPKKEFFGGKWREYERHKRKYERLGRSGKSLQERARLNTISWDFPRGDYFRGIGDTLHSSKTKVSSCQYHPTRPETGKKVFKNL